MSLTDRAALDAIPASMADAVRPRLDHVTVGGYKRFLGAMAHYTRRSGERLRHAASHAPEETLRDLFSMLAKEESGHYLLAEADLAAFGEAPPLAVPALVTDFHERWMASRDVGYWLGALYALEQVGGYLREAAMRNLARLELRRDQVRFVAVHLEVDEDHGARAALACDEWPDIDGVFSAARSAGDFWVALHLDALQDG